MIAPSQINNNLQIDQPVTIDTLAQAPIPREDVQRKQDMRQAWDAYKGNFHPPLKISPNQPDDNVLNNRCAPIVDKGASFLFGKILKVEATDESTDDNSKDSPIQDFINGLWGDDDEKMTLLSMLAVNGGVCGHAFLKLIPAQGSMKYPRLVVLDPQNVRIVTSPDDCSLIQAYVIEYATAELQRRQLIVRVDPDGMAGVAGEYDLDDTWVIANYARRVSGGSADGAWIPVGDQVKWPYPFAPVFGCQNLPNPNETWGKADLTKDIVGMNKVLNFVQSNTSRIIKYHAHPITYAVGLSSTQIQIGVDDLICLPSPDSKIEKIAAMENFNGLLEFAANLRADMDEQSRVPAVALGRTAELPKGNISGVALQLLFQPLIEKTIMKQRTFGKLIREVTRAALVVSGLIDLTDYESYPVEIHFPNLLPVDDLAAAQTAQLLQAIGVSQSTLMQELGYNPDDEADKTAQEGAKKLAAFSKGQGLPLTQQAMQIPQQDTQMQQQVGEGQS